MHKIRLNNKPEIIGQLKIAKSLACQVIRRFFGFYLLKSGAKTVVADTVLTGEPILNGLYHRYKKVA